MNEGATDCEGSDEFPASLCKAATKVQCDVSALVRRACRLSCGLCNLLPQPPPPPRPSPPSPPPPSSVP
eukprot:scaffold86527_cov21-Phaeocystis_antarctica.AAC.1